MYRLSDDFFHAASLYAQVIISELGLPAGLKSIQPVNVGGIAGGEKYIIDNILFKFSVDTLIGNDTKKVYMYGVTEQRNDLAMKAASIEMRNMQTVLTHRNSNLFVPLMCVIDYQGHRIIASSILPIDKNTLCYGSADGGYTVYNSIPELNNMMKELADRLHLQEHRAGSRRGSRLLHMPGDIEVHLGLDDKYYMLDMARLMPPEAPNLENSNSNDSRKIFYQTLRPELVLGIHQNLNSDAFSPWNDYDGEKSLHEAAIIETTKFLKEVIIPGFADALQDGKLEAITYLPPDRESWMKSPADRLCTILDAADMTSTVHYYGINVRHLGLIRSHVSKQNFRDFLLIQCLSRTMKNILRQDMRNLMKTSLGSPTDMPLRDLVLSTFKKIHPFNHVIYDKKITRSISDYWKLVFEKTKEQFENCFSDEEINEISSTGLHTFVQQRVDMRAIIYLFFKFGQVELKCDAIDQLMEPTFKEDVCVRQEFRLVRSDVQKFSPRIRTPYIASFASALLLAREAKDKILAKSNKYRLLKLSVYKMQQAHRASPSAAHLNRELSLKYVELSKVGNPEKSKEVLFPLFYAIRHMEMALSINNDCEIKKEFDEILDLTAQKCEAFELCVNQIASIRARSHTGIATCPKKRLSSGTSMLAHFSSLLKTR